MIKTLSWFTILKVVCLLVKANWLEQCKNKIGWEDIPIVIGFCRFYLWSPYWQAHAWHGNDISKVWHCTSSQKFTETANPMLLAFPLLIFASFAWGGLLMPKGKLRTKQCANHLSRYNNFAMLATHIGGQKNSIFCTHHLHHHPSISSLKSRGSEATPFATLDFKKSNFCQLWRGIGWCL